MKNEICNLVFAQIVFYVGRPFGWLPLETDTALSVPMQPVTSAEIDPMNLKPEGFEAITRLLVERR